MKEFYRAIVLVFSLLHAMPGGCKQIDITHYGIRPNDRQNALPAMRKALDACLQEDHSELVFPQGRYDFYVDKELNQSIGFMISKHRHLTIEGNGSEFIFHGEMSIANVGESSNVTLRNFSVDWERPFISQGQIVAVEAHSIDISIDKNQYPYTIENERILFLGEGWKRGVEWHNLYDEAKQEIVSQTLDMPLGDDLFSRYKTEEIRNGCIRIHATVPYKPTLGTYITLWHGRYIRNGISINESKDVLLENITLYHALSNGVLGSRSENITMRNVNMTANATKGRVFSLVADASHFNTCRGLIKIDHCTHTGQGDDFINIHGMNVKVQERLDDFTVITPPSGKVSSRGTFKENDEMWFVNQQTSQRDESRLIASIAEQYKGGELTGYIVRFTKKLPTEVLPGDFMENRSWTPDVHIVNCSLLKKHRARGILVSTPGKVVIENNYFRTAGAAILIEGDTNYWFESGACTDVLIRNNVFEDCMTSRWGDGIIAITPSHRPQYTDTEPYHTNIRILGNTFRCFDRILLYARSVDKLMFKGNTIQRTYTYQPFLGDYGFYLDGCRHVILDKNKYAPDFEGKSVQTRHMKTSDITIGDKELTWDVEAQTINARDYIKGKDSTPGVYEAIKQCKATGARKLIFPKGKYEFWPDYATEEYFCISNNDGSLKRFAFDLMGMKDFEVDGQGSEFIFHGFISPFLLKSSENISFRNFSIDYHRTFHSEGRIEAVYRDSIDISFSPAYPYKIDNQVLIFTDDEKRIYPWSSLLEFDPVKKETAYKVVDYWCGPHTIVKELKPGTVRLYHAGIQATRGNVMAFAASHRLVPAFNITQSQDIAFSHVNIYHCGGMGIVAQLSKNILVENVKVCPTPGSERVVSLTADATHFVNCTGYVKLIDCLFECQKDDATNIHGLYARIDRILSDREVVVRMVHAQQYGVDFVFPNSPMEFVESQSLVTYAENSVDRTERINEECTKVLFHQPLPKGIKQGDGIATLATYPEVLIRNCTIRGNRARGILLGSRARTVIEGNYFHTPGAAILLEGDCRYWYEQAGVRDLIVQNNVFDNCYYGTWGNAVIQVGSGIEEDKKTVSRYNRNILIENNTFNTFTPEILNLYAVDGLLFQNNTINKTNAYPCTNKQAESFIINHSTNVQLKTRFRF